MNRTLIALSLAAPLALPGCTTRVMPAQPDAADGSTHGKVIASSLDDPGLGSLTPEHRLDALATSGVPTRLPWTGPSWPLTADGIGARPPEGTRSPVERYADAFDVPSLPDVVSARHGLDSVAGPSCVTDLDCDVPGGMTCGVRRDETVGVCVPRTASLQAGLAAASIYLDEPTAPVVHDGVVFSVNDQKALASLLYSQVTTRSEDASPATLHVVLGNLVGELGESVVFQDDFDGGTIDRAVAGYEVLESAPIGRTAARDLWRAEPTSFEPGALRTSEWSRDIAALDVHTSMSVTVIPGQLLTATLNGQGELDLAVRFGDSPRQWAFDCADTGAGPEGLCRLEVPGGQSIAYVGVRNHDDEPRSYDLRVETKNPDEAPQAAWVPHPAMAELRWMKTRVDLVRPAPASENRGLTAELERFYDSRVLESILELDADGNIVGGVWVGDSRFDHPERVWAPTGLNTETPIADGLIRPADVHALLASVPSDTPQIAVSQTLVDAGAVAEDAWVHVGRFEGAVGRLDARLRGTGDLDLYVRRDAPPTLTEYDCRPYTWTSDEDCSLEAPGTFYVAVNGWTDGEYELTVDWTVLEDDPAGPLRPVTEHVDVTGHVHDWEDHVYAIPLAAGQTIRAHVDGGNKSVDLLARRDALADGNNYDAVAWSWNTPSEVPNRATIEWTADEAQTLFLAVGAGGYLEDTGYRLWTEDVTE